MRKLFDKTDLVDFMVKNGIETLADMDNIATITTSNFGGIVIRLNYTTESVFVQEVWSGGYNDIEQCKIEFNVDGQAYFEYNDEFYYLNEFMRVGVVNG